MNNDTQWLTKNNFAEAIYYSFFSAEMADVVSVVDSVWHDLTKTLFLSTNNEACFASKMWSANELHVISKI